MSDAPSAFAAIIIPVHNRARITLACLDRLSWCAGDPAWKIIVVDDGSTDGTGTSVSHLHPHVEIVAGNGQLYWTGAIAKGMKHAAELGATEIVWLNDDTSPDETSLRRIVNHVRHNPEHLLASCAMIDGKPAATCSLRRRSVLPVSDELAPVDVLAGYQVAFSVEVMRKIGLPDAKRWPHYGGDSSFTRQAHNAGFHLFVDGGSRVELCEPHVENGIAETFWRGEMSLVQRFQRTFFAKNSRFRFASRWHLDCLYRGVAGAVIVFPTRCLVWIFRIVWQRLPKNES
ncbi:MAG: glycosyltransferase [Verrucomicrobia bacterium]|nr:glycosyltransferase [Verrucomicrobiota bacterium]